MVSKKVEKSAVRRNKIRRRVYDAIRRQNIKKPYDIVVTIFGTSALEMSYEELSDDIHNLLKKSNIV